jgi:hypothetical protein
VTTTQDLPQGNKVANTQLFNQFWVVFDEIQYSLARLWERKLRSAPESGFLINFDLPSNHFQLLSHLHGKGLDTRTFKGNYSTSKG